MRIGQDRTIDYSKLGTALVAGAAVIYAIRTARQSVVTLDGQCANQEVQSELEYAVQMCSRILAVAMSRHAEFFEQKVEDFTTGVVTRDIPL